MHGCAGGMCGSAISAEEGHGADPAERPSVTLGEQLSFLLIRRDKAVSLLAS